MDSSLCQNVSQQSITARCFINPSHFNDGNVTVIAVDVCGLRNTIGTAMLECLEIPGIYVQSRSCLT